MTDTQAEAAPAETPPEHDGSGPLAALEAKVDRLAEAVAGLVSGGGNKSGQAEAEQEAGSVADEVKRELARLKTAEERKARTDAHSAKVDELEAKVKKITEKPPKEYRKITNWLWGDSE